MSAEQCWPISGDKLRVVFDISKLFERWSNAKCTRCPCQSCTFAYGSGPVAVIALRYLLHFLRSWAAIKCYDLTMHAPCLPSSSGVSVTADVGSRSLLNVISMASQPMETQVRSIDLTPVVLMDRLMFPNGHLLSELRVSTSSASRLRPVNVVAWLRTSLSGCGPCCVASQPITQRCGIRKSRSQ